MSISPVDPLINSYAPNLNNVHADGNRPGSEMVYNPNGINDQVSISQTARDVTKTINDTGSTAPAGSQNSVDQTGNSAPANTNNLQSPDSTPSQGAQNNMLAIDQQVDATQETDQANNGETSAQKVADILGQVQKGFSLMV